MGGRAGRRPRRGDRRADRDPPRRGAPLPGRARRQRSGRREAERRRSAWARMPATAPRRCGFRARHRAGTAGAAARRRRRGPLARSGSPSRAHTEAPFAAATTMENEVACRRYLALAEEAGDELGAGWAQAELARIVFHERRDQETQGRAEAAIVGSNPRRQPGAGLRAERWGGTAGAGLATTRRSRSCDGRWRSPTGSTPTRGPRPRWTSRSPSVHRVRRRGDRDDRGGVPAIAMEVGTPSGLGRIYNNYASIAGAAAPERAVAVLRQGLEATKKAGARQFVAWITGSLGDFEFQLGHLAESETLELESIELARAIGDDPLLGDADPRARYGADHPRPRGRGARRLRRVRKPSSPRTRSPRWRSSGTCSRRRSPGLGATERESWSG